MEPEELKLAFGGVTANEVFNLLKIANIGDEDAKRFVAGWIWENAYGTGRFFNYTHPIGATDPADSPAPFQRTFAHMDWIDGESTVQAGTTPTDEGFNARFHKIEQDLDKLGALMAQAFADLAALRGTLHDMLEEARSEINRINADVAALRRQPNTGIIPGPIRHPPIRFMGATKYFDQSVQVWQTEDGNVLTLPTVTPSTVATPGPGQRAPHLAEVIGRDGDLRAAFPAQVKVRDLVEKFGERRDSNGRPLSALVSALPPDQVFPNLDAVVSDMTDRDAALLHGTGADVTIRNALGADQGKAAQAPIVHVDGVTMAMSDALAATNVHNVGDLAGLTSDKLEASLATRGIHLNAGQAAGLIARAKTIRLM